MDWKDYLDQYSSGTRKKEEQYTYPVSDWSTNQGVLIQDPNKIRSEQSLISRVLSNEWKTALDYGCGVGAHFPLFGRSAKKEKLLIGIDADCKRVELAKITAKNIFKKIQYEIICGNHNVLKNAPDNLKVEHILCSQVLGHVSKQNLHQIMEGFYHILVEKGKCLILIPVIGKKFKSHTYHAENWDGKSDYTHIVNVSLSPPDNNFRQYIDPIKFDIIAEDPKENLLPVRSFLLPNFPEPSSTQLPHLLKKAPPTFTSLIEGFFRVKESYMYSIHRDTPESNYPVADILILLQKQ